MKVTVSGLREKYGDCYITELPDGHLVPWKGLTLKEYIKYKEDFDRELIAVPVLENEIFVKSVLDSFIVKNIDKQKAGTVSTVVSKIMEEAGPSNLFEFNYHLMAARQAITENVFHHIIALICVAFPGYTPDDLYKLEYETLMLRLAQAETHLLRTGYLEEPLQLSDADQSGLEQDSQPKIQSSELKHLFEKQELQRQEAQGVPKAQRRIKEDLTPKSEHKTKDGRVIISKEELQVKRFTGADMEDAPFMEQQMLEDAQSIYANYLEDVKAGKEVIIKTPEERLKEKKKKDKSRASKLKKING